MHRHSCPGNGDDRPTHRGPQLSIRGNSCPGRRELGGAIWGYPRLHAKPAACSRCGPRLWVADFQGAEICQDDPLAFIGVRVQEGNIIAVKGLGGYHLACDGLQDDVVRKLRQRKKREAKVIAGVRDDGFTVYTHRLVPPNDGGLCLG